MTVKRIILISQLIIIHKSKKVGNKLCGNAFASMLSAQNISQSLSIYRVQLIGRFVTEAFPIAYKYVSSFLYFCVALVSA